MSLSEAANVAPERGEYLIALDEALQSLGAIDPPKLRSLNCAFSVDSVDETAEVTTAISRQGEF